MLIFWQNYANNFQQMVHIYNHWVLITDYNPYYERDPNDISVRVFLYDSVNSPDFYITYLKPRLKRLYPEKCSIEILTCDDRDKISIKPQGILTVAYLH
jgi:hypothetical protein